MVASPAKKPVRFGKYTLLERVNVGGMAEVFKAKAFGVEGFERLVAVKRILPTIAEDSEFITMFIDEAKIAVQLTHANVAQIFDLGKEAESYFIAMEFVRGKDLRAIFDRGRKRGETVPVPMACYIVMKICEGLDYAHNKKDSGGRELHLVHRDVSPQNILLSYDGEIKLIDFGIAKAANKAGKTQAGILKGKFGYMSPEQVRGLPLDRRSDVFAVGICLYELLTGERLFAGESDFSTLEKVRNVDIMPPSTYNRRIPEELEQIVLRSLAKDVDDRYQTAMDLHDDLQSFMYTSGNFFARKDLGAFMRKSFADEIAREEARDEQFRHEEVGEERTAPPTSPPPSRAPKQTLLGMGIGGQPYGAPQGGASVPPAPPRALTPAPAAPLGRPGVPDLSMEWDDDELATQVYDKPEGVSLPQISIPSGQQRASFPGPAPYNAAAPSHSPAPPAYSAPAPAPRATPMRPPAATTPMRPPAVQSPLLGNATAEAGPILNAPTLGGFMPVQTAPRTSHPPSSPPTDFGPAGSPRPGSFSMPEAAAAQKSGAPIAAIAGGVLALLAVAAGVAWFFLRPGDPGVIRFSTEPTDVVVLLDEQPVSSTASPFELRDVEPGVGHLIEIRKRDFTTWSQRVELEAGQTLDLGAIALEAEHETPGAGTTTAATATGGVALSSVPPATLLIDGVARGTTPATITGLTAGSHTLRLEAPGRAPWETTIAVGDTVLPLAPVTLPVAVRVTFESDPAGATVVLLRATGEQIVGVTPTQSELPVSGTERVRVEMRLEGYRSWEGGLQLSERTSSTTVRGELRRVAGNPNPTPRPTPMGRVETTMVSTTMEAAETGGTGVLQASSTPYWSQVSVDGRVIGNTPQMNIVLPAGRHQLTFTNPEFNARKTVTVVIRAGETLRQVVRLDDQ